MSVRRRMAMTMVAVAAWGVILPGVAQAEPPTNDDFDASVVVTELPFTQTLDTTQATRAYDDPSSCQYGYLVGSVWFSYTPTEDMMLRATTAGSTYVTQVATFTGDRGALARVPACTTGSSTGTTITFPARAGTTYHVMVAAYQNNGGVLAFDLHPVAPASNDNFADAEPLAALPSTREVDLSIASTEFDEPASCESQTARSVWYRFTPAETLQMMANVTPRYELAIAVYTGDSLLGLQQVECAGRWVSGPALFRATAGVTYYIRIADPSSTGRQTTLSLDLAPPLVPRIIKWGPDPTIYSEASFSYYQDSDPFRRPLVGGQWDFGDGSTAPVSDTQAVYHHYTADGTYQVTLSVETDDGRTGTNTIPVKVETHDVSIDKFSVPAKARVGETKSITVDVANSRYPEVVTVQLYRVASQYWSDDLVGQLVLNVPAATGRTTEFPFAYTFTDQDAILGAVAFRAVVHLSRDARPFDNTLISMATTVRPSAASLRFA